MPNSTPPHAIITRFLHKRWMWHLAFWLAFFAVTLPGDLRTIYVASLPAVFEYNSALVMTQQDLVLFTLLTDTILVLFMYSVILVLYPLFFARQRYIGYGLGAIVFSLIFDSIHCFGLYCINPLFVLPDWLSCFLPMLSTFALFFFMLTTLKFFKDSLIQQEANNQNFRAAKQAELDNLKAQLSPHFLFNTLNNFYGLAVTESKQLPDLMLRLSDLMRYSLYETQLPLVPLADEVKYLKNYIALEKIRLEDSFHLDFGICEITENALKTVNIAPLILIVFVENAFKHTKNMQNEAVDIRIKLTQLEGSSFLFYIENPYLKANITPENSDKKASGLGLINVQKRLAALYPNGRHKLMIHDDGRHFKISLQINLA
jgi:two-component system, LytTR family, sensor histidine kinase LytS